ncbi:MAG: hypothetical protein JKX84_09855, partial [Flavobacteriales bacterium]|nr:hypothetical protein [Flavobacteriales bacterium]
MGEAMSESCSKDVCLTDETKPQEKNALERYKVYFPSVISFLILVVGITFNQLELEFFNTYF